MEKTVLGPNKLRHGLQSPAIIARYHAAAHLSMALSDLSNTRCMAPHKAYRAVTPPSMTTSLPVMNDDSSDARNKTP